MATRDRRQDGRNRKRKQQSIMLGDQEDYDDRKACDRGSNGKTSIYANLTDFATRKHDIDAGDRLIVRTFERGIVIQTTDQVAGELLAGVDDDAT